LDLRCILCFQQHHICFASLLRRSTRVPHPSARLLFALTLFFLFEFARLPTCVLTHKCQTLNDLMELRAPLIRSYRAVCNSHCLHSRYEHTFRFRHSPCGGGRMTCLPFPFAGTSIINTDKAFRFRKSLCGGSRVTCLPSHY